MYTQPTFIMYLFSLALFLLSSVSAIPAHSFHPHFNTQKRNLTPDNSCGGNNAYICNPSDPYGGRCCSAAGWCGKSLVSLFRASSHQHFAKPSQETRTNIAQPAVNLLLEAAAPLILHLHHRSHLQFRNPPNPHLRSHLRLHSPRQTHHQYQGILQRQTKRVACGK